MITRFLFQRWENHLSKLEDKKATNNQNELYQNPAESKIMLNCYCSTTSTTPALSASKCGITFYQSQAYPYIMTKLIYMFFISLTYQVF